MTSPHQGHKFSLHIMSFCTTFWTTRSAMKRAFCWYVYRSCSANSYWERLAKRECPASWTSVQAQRVNLIHFFDFFRREKRTVQPEIRLFALLLRSPVNHAIWQCEERETVSKSATFLATESVNSAPFKGGETDVQIFWQGKAQNSSPILRCTFLARRSAKLIAKF